ncbi:MAG: excinuclease ABC subunit B [Candidatus Ryanbacteria bacterium RIFCSPHIGHO2_02_FULL_45_43]|uniref:UvrABC system protein B n=1 Tax=Candidatus Ryanbacteria bacterium RIFCSPHIGHO2_01_45_13 TaxID=1802112 RepID=A0A1G2FXL1_9BACT|nr:MAG: excinuclease ABC subunit B [Candidatus Ryanbacteria bacterium RIFCSPHIGHO2_01_FULL_44_130]OGZ42815.1 MAG: excinuclease ABC subunit B [Candidatus Ryanbacteria bacterium RIFCSPHIGHO2_01_45_13]OGZ48239.1 MAG: excinuclease ABC subunit B [Candidatus Ryanbacteria bacterium RIFCSPHIGHO2_02_FULL_45_43]OGZ50015.1 MAG: excinuclease ABC subunit B [Candidatus Ryanbacteria bacterium RIFCSPHIGHO2_12_FULL_44_20]OGZ51474.1 MAG: excinuclease ABC subunit B [Candidatus Ryanbacteria bacterium RIFCSPLOWO2_0
MNKLFALHSPFKPAGDQPKAIKQLAEGIRSGIKNQTLLGVTGSGKTFTIANVIAQTNKTTLVLSHNKTLAAQLYEELKEFFPQNPVHYFVSYYDYYQPEAYIPSTDTFIEKSASINDFIDQLRHATTASLLSAKNCIVVASVSAIYGLGNPAEYKNMAHEVTVGNTVIRKEFLGALADLQYTRNDIEGAAGTFSVKGDVIEVMSPDGQTRTRIEFHGNTIERITERKNATSYSAATRQQRALFFPNKHFVTPNAALKVAIKNIEKELESRIAELKKEGKAFEAERLHKRTRFDMAMLSETGYSAGIENYSRHLSFRAAGEPPFTLLDYLGDDFLTCIDESHITIPQIRGMYNGDRARKLVLVENGFRLKSALDNRPLTFEEFEKKIGQTIYISATPAQYELARGPVIEQLVRPTGLLDPTVEILPTKHQIRDAIEETQKLIHKNERALLIALTKRNAEDIADYMKQKGIRVAWLHSDIETLERPEILRDLRKGTYDVLVGVNLLREGLDLPEVSLVCILDADKEGFLRNKTTLIQTMGRASRHPQGRTIFFADTITDAMKEAMEETARRRAHQQDYNKKHGIIPKALKKAMRPALFGERKRFKKKTLDAQLQELFAKTKKGNQKRSLVALKKEIEAEMLEAAANLEFEKAKELRDLLRTL